MHKFQFIRRHTLSEHRLLHFAGEEFGSELRMDIDPDEPDYVDNDGKTVENSQNRIKGMNKEEFKQHLHGMFEQHYNYKQRFTRGAPSGSGVESLVGGAEAMKSMLEDIASDIFERPEYQQGIANYNAIYTQAWDTYLDYVRSSGSEDPMWNSITRMQGAPGIYSNGELVRIPEMYTRRFGPKKGGRSEYAKQWLRKKVGVNADPENAYAQQKAAEMRTGYGKDWTRNIRARIIKEEGRHPSDEEMETHVNALIDSKLGGQLAAARVRPSLPPPPETPLEVRMRHTSSMEGNIPLAYRTRVGRMLNTQYEGVNARSEKQIDKQFRFELKAEGNTDVVHSRVVEYSKKGKLMRNESVEGAEPDKGVFVIKENPNDPTNALIHMVDFRTADAMLLALKNSSDPYFAPLMASGGFFSTKMKTEVFATTQTLGFEWQFYSQDQMVLLNNIVYPKLTAVMTVLKNNNITPANLAHLDSWDKGKGQEIRTHMEANPAMRDTWLKVLLVYCNGFEVNSNSEDDRNVQLFKRLGIIDVP